MDHSTRMTQQQQHQQQPKSRKTQDNCFSKPLVVMELGCSYVELVWMLEHLAQNGARQRLPTELLHKIAHFFTVRPVVSSEVQVVSASSTTGRHSLQAALEQSLSTWWMSRRGSMPRGKGFEYVEFQLADWPCRLTEFAIQIPPLPMSVRAIKLQAAKQSGVVANEDYLEWYDVSPIWTVQPKTEWQEYTLDPPVDVQRLRVLCLSNQATMLKRITTTETTDDTSSDSHVQEQYGCVGFYCVKFS